MNRHGHLPTLLFFLAFGSSCKGTDGSVFLDKKGSDASTGGSPDSSLAMDGGGQLPDTGGTDGSFLDPDGAVDDGGGGGTDGSLDTDSGFFDTDGGFDTDGAVTDDGGVPNVDCTQNPPVFPSFDRSCTVAADCAIGTVQLDCCGSLTITGIASYEAERFAEAAAICDSQFPGCGCASQPTRADDGTHELNSGPGIVQCVANMCQTTFPPAPTPCGPKSCDPLTEVCVARSPIGPSIQYDCQPIPSGCDQDRTCSCAGVSLCTAPFTSCSEQGPNQLSCECLLCQ